MGVSLPAAAKDKPLELSDFRLTSDSGKTELTITTSEPVEPKLTFLRGPNRLVIDLPEARFKFGSSGVQPKGLISEIRYGSLGAGKSRIILTTKKPFSLIDDAKRDLRNSKGNRLQLALEASTDKQFEEALAAQTTNRAPAGRQDAAEDTSKLLAAQTAKNKPFTVVIDAGHGGIDGGAESIGGTLEKEITLAFARELRDQLVKLDHVDAHMTRDDDSFLRLDERVAIARSKEADLFISIHADTIRLKGISGATIYTGADRASDAASAALADRENLSDQLAGIEIEDANHEVADILVDLIRRETQGFSVSFAKIVVSKLRDRVSLINNPHRQAGFRVLRAPDVPSVLVELGYLSNETDEQLLRDAEWRAKMAAGLVEAIRVYEEKRQSAE